MFVLTASSELRNCRKMNIFFGMTNFVPLGFTQIQSVSFCPVDFRFLYLDVFIYSNTVRNATYKYRLEITPMAFFTD